MFQVLKKRIKNEKGLSLVELLAVIVILGIVAAIAIPAIGNIIENSRAKAEISDAIQVLNSANLYFTDNPGEKEFKETDAASYLEYDTADKFTVTRNDDGDLVVAYKGQYLNSGLYTLSDLTALKVSGGEIEGGGSTLDPDPTPDPDPTTP